jgi:NAD(P)H dehydrogenase (quinone)
MAKVAVVFHSSHGNTAALAREVARGVELGGATSSLLEISGADVREGRWNEPTILAELEAADGIIFGSPTYMGSVSAVMKTFLERAFDPWLAQSWKDKVAGGFTNSASQSGDKLSTLLQLHVFAAQMGMIWVGVGDPPNNNWSGGTRDDLNRLGSWVGVMSQSHADGTADTNPSQGDRLTGRRYGKRIAILTRRFLGELADGEYIRMPIAEDEFRLHPEKFKAEVGG